jgi:N utilization substance protein A
MNTIIQILYKQFKDLIGEIYTEVHHVRPRVVILVDDEGKLFYRRKQIPSDFSVKEITWNY